LHGSDSGLGSIRPDGSQNISQTEHEATEKQIEQDLKKKFAVPLPNNDSQLKHIFTAKKKGHLADTSKNRKTLLNLANDKSCYKGTDKLGKEWYVKTAKNGGQHWVWVKNGVIGDGGYNRSPLMWNDSTGLCKPLPNNYNPTKKKGNKK